MDPLKNLMAEVAWDTAAEIVAMLRWDREEQQAEAFVEILVAVDAGLQRFVAARHGRFAAAAADPARN